MKEFSMFKKIGFLGLALAAFFASSLLATRTDATSGLIYTNFFRGHPVALTYTPAKVSALGISALNLDNEIAYHTLEANLRTFLQETARLLSREAGDASFKFPSLNMVVGEAATPSEEAPGQNYLLNGSLRYNSSLKRDEIDLTLYGTTECTPEKLTHFVIEVLEKNAIPPRSLYSHSTPEAPYATEAAAAASISHEHDAALGTTIHDPSPHDVTASSSVSTARITGPKATAKAREIIRKSLDEFQLKCTDIPNHELIKKIEGDSMPETPLDVLINDPTTFLYQGMNLKLAGIATAQSLQNEVIPNLFLGGKYVLEDLLSDPTTFEASYCTLDLPTPLTETYKVGSVKMPGEPHVILTLKEMKDSSLTLIKYAVTEIPGTRSRVYYLPLKELKGCDRPGYDAATLPTTNPTLYNTLWLSGCDKDEFNVFYNKKNEIFTLLDDALANDEVVYIHCASGVHRSATVLLSYLYERANDLESSTLRYSFFKIWTYIQTKRPAIHAYSAVQMLDLHHGTNAIFRAALAHYTNTAWTAGKIVMRDGKPAPVPQGLSCPPTPAPEPTSTSAPVTSSYASSLAAGGAGAPSSYSSPRRASSSVTSASLQAIKEEIESFERSACIYSDKDLADRLETSPGGWDKSSADRWDIDYQPITIIAGNKPQGQLCLSNWQPMGTVLTQGSLTVDLMPDLILSFADILVEINESRFCLEQYLKNESENSLFAPIQYEYAQTKGVASDSPDFLKKLFKTYSKVVQAFELSKTREASGDSEDSKSLSGLLNTTKGLIRACQTLQRLSNNAGGSLLVTTSGGTHSIEINHAPLQKKASSPFTEEQIKRWNVFCSKIDTALANNKTVLVLCRNGDNVSAAFLFYYLATRFPEIPLHQINLFLHTKRPIIESIQRSGVNKATIEVGVFKHLLEERGHTLSKDGK